MNLRVVLIGLTAVVLLVGMLELVSIATEHVTRARMGAPSISSGEVEPQPLSAPEIEDAPPAASPTLTH